MNVVKEVVRWVMRAVISEERFLQKMENMKAAVALHFAHYNFVRLHQSIRVTPAMEAGVTNHLWSMEKLILEAEG